ncbi:hypothetical protein AAG747_05595 [Rapidithrix thailandica]|uniref:Uncharacterized protein n=1 Tax=Rapidithrix thailandica TaxID=413964 RepID=A0AAW9S4S7_9BACT
MKTFQLKTYRPKTSYAQARFFILSKGMNSGKPLKEPCPNCFVCLTPTEKDREYWYWLCLGLWHGRVFHYYLRGSVIPFITLGELKECLQENERRIRCQNPTLEKYIQALKLLEVQEQKAKGTLEMIDTARQALFYKMMRVK